METDICRAGRWGELDVVRFLLESGVHVDSCDDNGDTLLVSILSWNCSFSKREKKRQLIKQVLTWVRVSILLTVMVTGLYMWQ